MIDVVDYEHIDAQLTEHHRRLKVLELQLARTGDIYARPEVITEIEDIQGAITSLEAQLWPDDVTRVHLISYKDTQPFDNQDYVLDWSAYYQPVPTFEQWQTILFPDLLTFRRLRNQQATLLVQANAYLSAGMVFGYAFHNRQNFKVWIEQRTEGLAPQIWRSDSVVKDANLIQVNQEVLDRQSGDILIELNISRTTTPKVDEWLENKGINSSIQRRITIKPKDGTSQTAIRDSIHATDLARAIGQEIASTCDAYPHATIHLFASYPIGLAVLVGMHLNACKQIKWYDQDKYDVKYYEGCTLMREI